MQGKVYIVGAGPGAADLLTVRAESLLRAAEVVLHDDLVPSEILALIAATAKIINVGKRHGKNGSSQEQIDGLMVRCAREHKVVVRLKSGDPAIFGRMGEEIDALRQASIPFEIVPGVTAASAAAAAANFTLTDRRAASALVILTAHSSRDQSTPRVLLDPDNTTYAIYMPGPDYGEAARQLHSLGLDAETPCALVSNAGRESQRIKFLPLSELQTTAGLAAPAILIVGKVVENKDLSTSAFLPDEIKEWAAIAFQSICS